MTDAGAPIAFIDTHVHLWDDSVGDLEWTWMKPTTETLGTRGPHDVDAPRYTPVEFMAESDGASVDRFVAVHSATLEGDPRLETAWFEHLSRRHPALAAAVGSCQLSAPDAVDVLHAHAALPIVRGVRDLTVSQGLDLDVVAPAMDAAAALGLSVEMRTPLEQLPLVRALAERWPASTVILGHAGLPRGRTPESLGPWATAITDLSNAPNVVCKISAVASASDPQWTLHSIRPWIEGCIDAFGPERCMFATNWPFDRPWSKYVELVDAYRQVVSGLSLPEQRDVLQGTAERSYRLTP